MFNCQCLALLISAAIAGCSAYNYKCLPSKNGSDIDSLPIRQFQYMELTPQKKLPDCTSRRSSCQEIGLIYADPERTDSDVYIIIVPWRQCESLKGYIVNALRNEGANFLSSSREDSCQRLNLGHATSWLANGDQSRHLMDCLINICTDTDRLSMWQMAVRLTCWNFMGITVGK